jgi:hypothetical protein
MSSRETKQGQKKIKISDILFCPNYQPIDLLCLNYQNTFVQGKTNILRFIALKQNEVHGILFTNVSFILRYSRDN